MGETTRGECRHGEPSEPSGSGAERAAHLHTPLPSQPDATDGPAQDKEGNSVCSWTKIRRMKTGLTAGTLATEGAVRR